MSKKISVIGLGKLGAPMLAVFASKGYTVFGADPNPIYVDAINNGRSPVEEPGVENLISENTEKISATVDTETAVLNSEISFVIVPTPTEDSGFFSNDYVISAMQEIGVALRKKTGDHLVVVTSTVMPGSTGGVIRATLEMSSGRDVGENLGLCYNPEFIALGTVVRDMLQPDIILIGENDKKSGLALEAIYRETTESSPEFHRMSWINAEITKISINTYVTTKISYANMIADICDRLPGAEVEVVTRAIGGDSRIGRKYLRGATGYGGPCFPRDNKAFVALGKSVHARTDLAEATDKINSYQTTRILQYISKLTSGPSSIAILGIAYKPGTIVTEESQSLILALKLSIAGHTVILSDPAANPPIHDNQFNDIGFSRDHREAIQLAEIILLMTPWPAYRDLETELSKSENAKKYILDPWHLLDNQRLENATRYLRLGNQNDLLRL